LAGPDGLTGFYTQVGGHLAPFPYLSCPRLPAPIRGYTRQSFHVTCSDVKCTVPNRAAGMTELKQYGLHRSGTNYLRIILQENYHVSVLTNVGGWKHGFYELPQRLGRELDCAICMKDPYAWVHSFYNYRHPEKDIPFSDFVRGKLTLVGPDGPEKSIVSDNPMKHWVRMHEHWLGVQLKDHQKFVYRYEDVLAAPYNSIQELVQTLQLERRRPLRHRVARFFGLANGEAKFFLPNIRLGAVPEKYKDKHFKRGETFDANRYTKQKYLDAFTPDLLGFANSQLDRDLVRKVDYRIVEPEELLAHQPA